MIIIPHMVRTRMCRVRSKMCRVRSGSGPGPRGSQPEPLGSGLRNCISVVEYGSGQYRWERETIWQQGTLLLGTGTPFGRSDFSSKITLYKVLLDFSRFRMHLSPVLPPAHAGFGMGSVQCGVKVFWISFCVTRKIHRLGATSRRGLSLRCHIGAT